MCIPFKLKRRSWYPFIFFGLVLVLLAVVFGVVQQGVISKDKSFEAVISALGIAAGFTHFLYSQYFEQTRLFHDLAQEFNKRYDRLNGRLNCIRKAKCIPDEKTKEGEDARNCLFDYFNLCGEEYLYFHAGHIDPHVWVSWCVGMSDFAKAEHIKQLWEEELRRPSYYGFDLKKVIETAEKATQAHGESQPKTMGDRVETEAKENHPKAPSSNQRSVPSKKSSSRNKKHNS